MSIIEHVYHWWPRRAAGYGHHVSTVAPPGSTESPNRPEPEAGSGDKSARWSTLLEHLSEQGRLGVAEAAGLLGVSEATIRRDFADLARRQLAQRTHGGIVASAVAYELPFRYRSAQTDDAKARIAAVAAEMVRRGEVVGFNGGTTTTATARALTSRADLVGEGTDEITLVTNALNIASEAVLRPFVRCVSLGGVARPVSYEVTGTLAALALDQLWLDVAILGIDAFSARAGATCRHEAEAAVSARMVDRCDRVVVVATGDKIGRHSFAAICPAEQVRDLVTDATADPEALAALREAGVSVHVA